MNNEELDPTQMDEQYNTNECDELRADIVQARLGIDPNFKDPILLKCPVETIHFSKGGLNLGGKDNSDLEQEDLGESK